MARLITIIACILLNACSAPPPSAAEYVLTYASPYPPGHPFSRADISWMEHVSKASGGRIAFKPYWSGALISSDMSLTEIRHGLADIGLVTPIYARGGAHMLRVQSGFYGGVRDIAQQVRVYDCLAAQFPAFDKELTGLHVLAAQGGNFPGILTRSKPVRTLADLKGLRLRAQSDAIDILRELGADPVNMPMGEVYSALAKGVIDGVVAPADTIKSLHFAEVTSHFTSLKFSRGAYPARAMSDRAWQRLPVDLRTVLDKAKPVWEAALAKELVNADKAGLAFAADQKMEIITIAAAEQARFDALYNRFAREQAQGLSEFGINGKPVLAEAQRLIGHDQAQCTPRPSGTNP